MNHFSESPQNSPGPSRTAWSGRYYLQIRPGKQKKKKKEPPIQYVVRRDLYPPRVLAGRILSPSNYVITTVAEIFTFPCLGLILETLYPLNPQASPRSRAVKDSRPHRRRFQWTPGVASLPRNGGGGAFIATGTVTVVPLTSSLLRYLPAPIHLPPWEGSPKYHLHP